MKKTENKLSNSHKDKNLAAYSKEIQDSN